ncbi:hypothetical protein SAMN06272771_0893 [Streptomyces sp. Ag82_O1-12]|nr:hypothetical protein SAMN06272771_0893 [Streptomyces sp. Ag82_O1-12]SOD43619.1 hypothetical protein SAMN06272727_0884 [Streptomyces sp. Ag82_G6-1]
MRVAAAVMGLVVPVVAGCSSSPASPKQELIRSADASCREINERFTGDLAYGAGIDESDVPKMGERVVLLKGLRAKVRKMPKPESGRKALDAWSDKLGTYITGLEDLKGQIQNYRLGTDLVLIMQSAVNKDAAEAVGPAAKRFGFTDCAATKKWEYLAS